MLPRPATGLVAAGVVLGRNQNQPGAARIHLRLRLVAERVQDADDGGICGENAQTNGRDDSNEKDDGHNNRDHDQPTSKKSRICCSASPTLNFLPQRKLQAFQPQAFSNLTALTLRAVNN
jgi:hypothetical protein